MPRRKKIPPLALFQTGLMEKATGLLSTPSPYASDTPNLPKGVNDLLHFISTRPQKKSEEMYCLIMYDIENNKIRRLIAKYLERKGCIRIQKSIFFAKLHRNMYKEITETLREIQEVYQNEDSILLVPVGEDMLNNFTVIGRLIEFELATQSPHTMFF